MQYTPLRVQGEGKRKRKTCKTKKNYIGLRNIYHINPRSSHLFSVYVIPARELSLSEAYKNSLIQIKNVRKNPVAYIVFMVEL